MAKSYALFIWAFILFSCKKDTSELHEASDDIKKAKVYFESQVEPYSSFDPAPGFNGTDPLKTRRKVLWNKATLTKNLHGTVVIAPVLFEHSFSLSARLDKKSLYDFNSLNKLLVYTDEQDSMRAELITMVPDSDNANRSFSGLLLIHDWDGYVMRGVEYKENRLIRELLPNDNSHSRLLCVEYSGYNYSPATGEYTYWSVNGGCFYISDMTTDKFKRAYVGYDEVAGGGGGGGGALPVETFNIVTGDNVISNVAEYLKCFDNIAGNDYRYQVTLCVSQPKPGSREPWAFGNSSLSPVFVGHTFLILTEKTASKTVTRNIGFYPAESVWPYDPQAPGRYNNDANHSYNISLTIDMTNSQFTTVVNYISQSPGQYDLNDRNCTTFALNALNAAGYVLPRTKGSWQGGSGTNPGDLGEDIRAMTLQTGMTRNSVFNYHPNVGDCQ